MDLHRCRHVETVYDKCIHHLDRRCSKTNGALFATDQWFLCNPVSYTHLRAHETGRNLVCRLLLEKKGQGAYFSSGSRPNQSAHSWGRARLASAITGGKSAAVDFSILDAGCNHATSKAYKMARRAVEKYGYGKRHTPRVKL